MTRRSGLIVAAIAGFAVAAMLAYSRAPRGTERSSPPKPSVLVPSGTRVRVEVLNASTVRGLARRATMYLRDRGFDVVESGTTTTAERRDSTLVLDRTGHAAWAALASKAMGNARIEARPDTLRDVDLTILVGATWRPPAEPFYP